MDPDLPPPSAVPPAAPEPPPPAAPARRRRGLLGRLAASLSAYLAGVGLVLGLLVAGLGWLLYTEAGSGWLLARIPGLQVGGLAGSVLGGLSAQQVELALPGDGGRLRLQDLRVGAPRLHAGEGTVWLRIAFDEVQARRVDLALPGGPSTTSEPPASLALPVGLDVAALRIDEFHVDGMDTPLRELRARIELSGNAGRTHRLDAVQLQWDRLRLAGRGQVATTGTLEVDAELQLSQPPGAQGEWGATVQLQGPLAAPRLQARLRAQAAPGRPAQTLDASAALQPFAAWPLGELQAQARALDLSALHDAAPRTALDLDAAARTDGFDRPAAVQLALDNRDAGRWNEGRLPLRTLRMQLQARPDDPTRLEVQTLDAELGTARAGAGRVTGSGQWNPADWRLDARLAALQPAQLDTRAPDMRLDGRLQVDGSGFGGPERGREQVQLRGNLEGRRTGRGPTQPVQLRLDARLSELRIDLRELLAQAGGAQARLSGRLVRAAPTAGWSAIGQVGLRDFDPQPWWPGAEDSPWRRGPHRLNASGDFDLNLPAGSGATALETLARVRGRAALALEPSRLAGVPLDGRLSLQTAADGSTRGQLALNADGNHLQAAARLDRADRGSGDHWDIEADLPALKRLQPLWKLLRGAEADSRLAGRLKADARVEGRWPLLATQGRLEGEALQVGALQAERAEGRWTLGSRSDAPLDAKLELKQVRHGAPSAERIDLRLKGTPAAHGLEVDLESKALPPAWVEAIQAAPARTAAKRTLARLALQGGVLGAAPDWKGWRGRLQALELRGDAAAAPPWLQVGEFGLELLWAGGPLRLAADAGRARLLGASVVWSRIAWSAADGSAPARLDAEAALEPLDVAPLLARVQPGFGWGGDLRLGGRLVVHSAPAFSADVVVERSSGDLSVTDDAGTRTLGLSDLRIGLEARDGVWNFTTGLAGKTLGSAVGALVVRTSPKLVWPAADAPMQGVLDLRIADLGVWGPWLPPGWRLTGAMQASAAVDGRFGAPEITGELAGQGIGVRNVLQGVDVRDGELRIVLLGDRAHIEKFAASAGQGRLSLLGDAELGAEPRAELGLTLERFQLLGRVDRRVVASGGATLRLGRDTLALDGDFRVDEGLIDFSRSDAPRLSDDVQVHRGGAEPPALLPAAADAPEAGNARARRAALDLRVQLGEQLRIRGHGLDAGLRGELRVSAPQGRLRVNGSVRTVDGTYRAYRQRLNIERGVLTFNGPVENPQLDIEAIRPNLDVRVGVGVTGTVLVPRVRLFSEPEMSDAEKLSWLLRGRASEGPGSGDAALLQAAAVALLAGDEPGVLDQLFGLIGLDELSVRQSEGAAGGTVFAVGKQLSRRWYVGYERGLNATTGNWQLIYRIAQRFTVRAQSGDTNSIELIWTWRWN
jgi:translocation and assembly module TamB